MDTVTIRSANHASSMTLCRREPPAPSEELAYFTVRLTDTNLDATARVYGFMSGGLTSAFDQVSAESRTFTGPLEWSSLEGEFRITITHDGLGHFTIRSILASSPNVGWQVVNHVVVETAQLDRIAADVRSFVGRHS